MDQQGDDVLVDEEGNELDFNDVTGDELIEQDAWEQTLGATRYTANCMLTDPDLMPPPPQEPDVPRPAARLGMKTFRSGPKAVRADFEEAKLKMRARRTEEKIRREDKISRAALGQSTHSHVAPSNKLQSAMAAIHADYRKKLKRQSDGDSDDFSDLESEDELTIARKQQIYLELHNAMNRYGQVMELTQASFLEEIDNEPANVLIVVVIYQDYQERCQRFLHGIHKIAQAAPHIKFCQGRADKILERINDSWVPLVYFYRNKKELQMLSHVTRQLPQGFGDNEVVEFIERYLMEYGEKPILKLVQAYQETNENDDPDLAVISNAQDEEDSDGELDID